MAAVEINVIRLVRVAPPPAPVADARAERCEVRDSRAAFDALVRQHGPALQAFATRLCGSNADARDLVQDTHERALRRFDTFAPGTNARAWLFTIMHRAFIDRCRRRAVERRRIDDIDDLQVPAPEPIEPPAWASVSPDQLARAIAALEDEFRSVYKMHALQSLSYKEISEQLGVPVSTVGTRLNRARQKLRALLEAAVGGEVET
jgi:RNA polymerase sigma-70 factor (ECF subfamily)